MWYHEQVGGGRCPIVDTWWQTETGAIMISPLPGVTRDEARLGTRPLPGHRRRVVDEEGAAVPLGEGGYLVAHAARGRRCCARLRATTSATSKTYWESLRPARLLHRRRREARQDGYYWLSGASTT